MTTKAIGKQLGPIGQGASGFALGSSLISLFFALLYVLVPWEDIRGREFIDIVRYVSKIETIRWHGAEYFEIGQRWIDLLKAEYLWFLILEVIARSHIDPRAGLLAISLFCVFWCHRFLAAKTGWFLASIILINPISIQVMMEQVRSCLAFSIFLMTLQVARSPRVTYLAFTVTVFLHTAMFGVLAMVGLTRYVATLKRQTVFRRAVITAGAGVLVGAAIAVVVPFILASVEDRRGTTESDTKSLLYLSFWIGWGVLLVWSSRFLTTARWDLYFAILLSLAVPTMSVLGFPGFRFIALAIPVIIGAVVYIPKLIQPLGLIAFLAYQTMLFNYWIGNT